MTTNQVSFNGLPIMGNSTTVFSTVILGDNSLNKAAINNVMIMYGNVTINGIYVTPQDNQPFAVGIYSTFSGVEYFNILYSKAIYPQVLPDNFRLLVQKVPLGIFDDLTINSLMGQILNAKSQMLNDYYRQYFYNQNLIFGTSYSQALEYELNGTKGLLSNSTDISGVFTLLLSSPSVKLNSYDLELFISKYIYYRLDISCPIYIDDYVTPIQPFWYLGREGFSELGVTTRLGDPAYQPVVTNLTWVIYNSSTFSDNFKEEITELVIRMSRADLGNYVTFSDITDPTTDGFTSVGYTYQNDPRLIYGKCLAYTGNNNYPLNILGYYKI